MINLKYNFFAVVLLSINIICSSKVFINGVSHICHNPDGRVGRCTSRESCHNYTNCNRTASVYECPNGHGQPPFVCCIFGSSIVFPDDAETTAEDASITTRNTVAEPSIPSILFPDDNGNFNIPSHNKTLRSDRFGEQPVVLAANVVDLFPKPPVCGPMTVGDKIYNGLEAELGEFAWLVNLEYRTEYDDLQIACAGNIINHRFVLTAAHCVVGKIEEKVGHLESLRAGDHNTETDLDCDKIDCISPFARYTVIQRIVHEKYEYTAQGRTFNDIALLKTDRKMLYSFAVAPICLPDTTIPMPTLRNGLRLTVAGWGADVNANYTDEKRIVDVPYVANQVCPLKVKTEQICAGGLDGKDSCTGDSGGSLCRLTARGWLIEGIVSYGRKCGTHKPGVYTRVRSFLTWIHAKVDEN